MGFARYEAYKDSGVEWLGEVPEHWEVLNLKRVVVFQRGHDLPTEERQPGKVPVVSSGGYSGNHNIACAKAPGIVTGRYGSIGEFILVEQDYWPLNTALYSTDIYDNEPRYVWYLLQAHHEHFVLNSLKSAVPGVDRNDIHVVKVVLSPKSEQIQISDFLDRETTRIDALIAEQRRLIELLKEKRQAVISHAVTKGLDPTVPMKDSGVEWLGEVPTHWKVMKLARALKGIEQGWSPNASNEPAAPGEWGVIKISSIKKGLFLEAENKSILEGTVPDISIEVKHRDLLLTRANTPDLVGDACVVQTKPHAHLMLSDLTYRLNLEECIEPEFICLFLISSVGRAQIKGDARGSSMSMAKISQGHIKSWNISLPDHKEQLEICSYISKELRKIDCLVQESLEAKRLLQERRSALISAAVTGKIDLRKWQAPAST